MNLSQLQQYIGKEVGITMESNLIVHCKIKDVRSSFGHDEYLITPLNGSGEKWIRNLNFIKT